MESAAVVHKVTQSRLLTRNDCLISLIDTQLLADLGLGGFDQIGLGRRERSQTFQEINSANMHPPFWMIGAEDEAGQGVGQHGESGAWQPEICHADDLRSHWQIKPQNSLGARTSAES